MQTVTQVINTYEDAMAWMARYAGGSVPAVSDTQYAEWLSWLSEGQEDMAERGFWSRLLTKTTLAITKNIDYATLPADFHKRNGIFVLKVGGTDWNEANNNEGQKLFVNRNASGSWIVTFLGFTPTEDASGELWYFRHPGKPQSGTDKLILDGKATGFYALIEYFRQAGELGSMDDARAEYNNRFEEALGLEMLPSPQELTSWKSYYKHANIATNERAFYTRNRRRH